MDHFHGRWEIRRSATTLLRRRRSECGHVPILKTARAVLFGRRENWAPATELIPRFLRGKTTPFFRRRSLLPTAQNRPVFSDQEVELKCPGARTFDPNWPNVARFNLPEIPGRFTIQAGFRFAVSGVSESHGRARKCSGPRTFGSSIRCRLEQCGQLATGRTPRFMAFASVQLAKPPGRF